MSRIGKKIIMIPEKTEVKFVDGIVTVKGPLGELTKKFDKTIEVVIEGGTVVLKETKSSTNKALWGTYASHITNMIAGVNKPYQKQLIIEGIGYKADVKGAELVMGLGFSHLVKMAIPADLKIVSEKGTVTVSGIDKEKVGQYVAQIRAYKKPEPYKGKGIRYSDEVIRRKQGKKAA